MARSSAYSPPMHTYTHLNTHTHEHPVGVSVSVCQVRTDRSTSVAIVDGLSLNTCWKPSECCVLFYACLFVLPRSQQNHPATTNLRWRTDNARPSVMLQPPARGTSIQTSYIRAPLLWSEFRVQRQSSPLERPGLAEILSRGGTHPFHPATIGYWSLF